VEACQAAFDGNKRIDVLLNVAGISDFFQTASTLEDEVWEKVMSVNVTAPVRLMREVLKVMQVQKSGSIVNVASKLGISGAAGGIAYTASKHALVRLAASTFRSTAPDQVHPSAWRDEKYGLDVQR